MFVSGYLGTAGWRGRGMRPDWAVVILAELLLVILVNDKLQPRGTFGPALLIGTVGGPTLFMHVLDRLGIAFISSGFAAARLALPPASVRHPS